MFVTMSLSLLMLTPVWVLPAFSTLWIHVYFINMGPFLQNLQVQVKDIPECWNITYPNHRQYTSFCNDDSLHSQEQDFVAFRVSTCNQTQVNATLLVTANMFSEKIPIDFIIDRFSVHSDIFDDASESSFDWNIILFVIVFTLIIGFFLFFIYKLITRL